MITGANKDNATAARQELEILQHEYEIKPELLGTIYTYISKPIYLNIFTSMII